MKHFISHFFSLQKAIDEVDALAPKRNEKTGTSKVDVLCLLLSLIGGIKDVPNVFVIASTNRLNKMDEAFCRRLDIKFFVGRLDPKKRLEILLKIEPQGLKIGADQHEWLKKLTTNFSGAAMGSLRSRIVSYMKIHYENSISNNALLELADKVAIDFQILVGSKTIPMLLKTDIKSTPIRLDKRKQYTGKVLVDLTSSDRASIQLEFKYVSGARGGGGGGGGGRGAKQGNDEKKEVDEVYLENVEMTHDVIPSLLNLSIAENIDFIQMFDTNMLLNNAAFDDNTVMECIVEKVGEWEQYPRSMALFDVDPLIGITENMSDSSMGQSSSYSIANNRLWNQIVIQTANSKLYDANGIDHKWVVIISKNEFICKQFKTLTKFPLTRDEIKQKEDGEKERTCINCEVLYNNQKNGIDSCNYHDGPLIDNRSLKGEITPLDKEALYGGFPNLSSEDKKNMLSNFIYYCCFQQHNSAGCKKGYHSDTHSNKDFARYEKYFM